MTQTVVGLFSTTAEAESVVADLSQSGFNTNQITVSSTETVSTVGTAANTAAGKGNQGGFWGWLTGNGIPDTEAGYYAEGVRRNGTLVTVKVPDNQAQQAADIMSKHNAINIDNQGAEWKKSGWKGYDPNSGPYTGEPLSASRKTVTTNDKGETVLPVIEEQLQVGKRAVEGGGVRIYTHVTEKPVEEQISLHQEKVTVERRPVDRKLDPADVNAFKDQSIEMTEHSEEAVVSKSARVIEEVVLHKDVSDRTETVRDTVRRTDVKVEENPTARKTSGTTSTVKSTGFDTYATDFRSDYDTNYTSAGYSYDQYAPAYRYGYDLANDPAYAGKDWSAVNNQIQSQWEERNPGTWADFKNAISYGWNKVRGKTA